MSTDDTKTPDKSSLKVISNFRKSPEDKSKKKDKYRGIHDKVVSAMLGNHGRMPAFPVKLHRWVDHEGNSQIYEQNENGIVRFVADDHVNNLIAQYWQSCLDSIDEYWGAIAADDAQKIRKLWLIRAMPKKERWLPLAFCNSPELALHKVSFVPMPDFGTGFLGIPRYADLMARMTDSKMFMAWVGSLFDPKSQRQQYAWIYGSGGNGKSALIRAIMNQLGPVAANENPPTKDAKHWTVGLRNKRLVVFADCNNTSFITSGEFKGLTGEDGVRVEPKGKPAYTEHLHAKFLVSSNDKPSISSNKADLRRILFFKIGEISHDFGSDYEEQLNEETDIFLTICWNVYQEVTKGNPRHQFVCENTEQIDSVIDDSEFEMESFALGRLVLIEYESSTPDNARKCIEASKMIELMEKSGFKTEYQRKKLKDFLERKHGIVCKKVCYRSEKTVRKVFLNCLPSL